MSALLLLLAAALQVPSPQAPATVSGPKDERAREDAAALRAIASLGPDARKDLADYFRLEARHLGTVQTELVRFVLATQDRDPSMWPEEAELPHYDSSEHTPENDIPRHRLEPDSAAVRAMRKKVAVQAAESRLERGFRYDYAAGVLRRAPGWKDPGRTLRNGLAGYPPDADLVLALVERAQDDGSRRKVLAAFLHAYTDRDGGVYPGISLYEAWASGAEIEMPDVDCLGIVHDLLGDWKTWRAPVPSTQHKALYDRIGGLFLDAHRYVGLRRAVAACYLEGSATLDDGWQGYLDNLHALWEDCSATPAEMAKRLPPPERRGEWQAAWTKTCFEQPGVWDKGQLRRRVLDADADATRALLLRLLLEFRPATPAPPGRPADARERDGR